MFELQSHPWLEMFDEDLEKSIEEASKSEEDKKESDDEDDAMAADSSTKPTSINLEVDNSSFNK
jgi:hypothetical protein